MSGALAEAPPAAATEPDAEPHFDVIELLFFAYRDFVSDPDRILTDYGFGRAHHRVLHFVNRQPGLTIAELLDILRITKQSLNRVLKELVEKGFIEQRPGVQDRRQRLLFPTAKGRSLALALSRPQDERIRRAINRCGEEDRQAALRFLFAMIDENDRDHVARLVYGAGERKGQ
ncbi:MarR family winged helix-turn-helix transcriptional regulator [Chelatococcus composti]|uniref:DNA-binding MarR family transcriptional regulator n=1 Tax=Chelatococcus composti TaxID=1743235 RepID=A0A841KF86_9HYPH|nr:MarR family transcriptional regulator [Chelatococcus composti]MBB6167919.1 DNA-binding MarR family transcriptional regulator [Chelatococcus composti]MBS7734886.1 MarR family transcriptional regulator [Chelatococcus composti]GGG34930.1 MarR family transcriptional regulator [Chelatococcus composti]